MPKRNPRAKPGRFSSHALNEAARTARRAGWLIEILAGGHCRWVSPGGRVITTGSSPRQPELQARQILMAVRREMAA